MRLFSMFTYRRKRYFLHFLLSEFGVGWVNFNRPSHDVDYFCSENGQLLKRHCRTANRKCPALLNIGTLTWSYSDLCTDSMGNCLQTFFGKVAKFVEPFGHQNVYWMRVWPCQVEIRAKKKVIIFLQIFFDPLPPIILGKILEGEFPTSFKTRDITNQCPVRYIIDFKHQDSSTFLGGRAG